MGIGNCRCECNPLVLPAEDHIISPKPRRVGIRTTVETTGQFSGSVWSVCGRVYSYTFLHRLKSNHHADYRTTAVFGPHFSPRDMQKSRTRSLVLQFALRVLLHKLFYCSILWLDKFKHTICAINWEPVPSLSLSQTQLYPSSTACSFVLPNVTFVEPWDCCRRLAWFQQVRIWAEELGSWFL